MLLYVEKSDFYTVSGSSAPSPNLKSLQTQSVLTGKVPNFYKIRLMAIHRLGKNKCKKRSLNINPALNKIIYIYIGSN